MQHLGEKLSSKLIKSGMTYSTLGIAAPKCVGVTEGAGGQEDLETGGGYQVP